MSCAIVVRRYKCIEETTEFKKTTLHSGILQISGPNDSEMYILSREMCRLGSNYKIACNCCECLSYKEEVRSGPAPTTEPFVKGLGITFNILCGFDYELKSTSTVQNGDGSNSTTWVWIRKKINSEI